mmetsp:Transcript_36930/g.86549  ORF Transcript_36930/g.86549 Transcript_36930/m.86549 type:complete len:1416 (-) Transcript_36930:112-4359(-)
MPNSNGMESIPEEAAPSLSSEQVSLIQSTWKDVEELGAEKVGVLLFKNIFQAAPGAAALFPFGRSPDFDPNGDLAQDPALVAHAVGVVTTVSTAVGLLKDLPKLVPVLQDLGAKHVGYGVKAEHYPIVGAAFLKTLQMGLGKAYTPEVTAAYTAMWAVVAATMQDKPAPLTADQVKVIQSTWRSVEKLGAEKVGVLLFQNIFDAAPEAAGLFPFGRAQGFDPKGDLSRNTALVTHAVGVVNTVATAVGMLDNLPKLGPVLKDLGAKHVKYGVKAEHYPIVGGAFLKTLEMGLGEAYTPEVTAAYTAMWKIVAKTMQDDEEDVSRKQSWASMHSDAESAEEEEEDGGNADGGGGGDENLDQVNVDTFEELHLPDNLVQATQEAWRFFMAAAKSQEAAGEAIYTALFEGAPSLQSLFTTPRAVQAMKFMHGIQSFATYLDDPPKLKVQVETLAFGHLHLDVTVPRVVLFRDAILDLFSMELGERFTTQALMGWKGLMNYIGGAIIFVKRNYADRINTLLESWRIANKEKVSYQVESGIGMGGSGPREAGMGEHQSLEHAGDMANTENNKNINVQQVPTTYPEMFMFNAVVMGFGDRRWFQEVLACFDNIVKNVANSGRLQEECDILVLRIARCGGGGTVNFSEYKSCMLASLRSLLPKNWSTAHEVAWSWLWENVERLLETNMGLPMKWERSLTKLLATFDENAKFELRKDVYNRFFAVAPAGQDYFKQSNTYLHFIAEKILDMTLEILREPAKMVDDVSALGLRHVGYGIPTELFGPFVSACVEVLTPHSEDEVAIKAFRWSLGLVAKMLVRVILEGSTIVMKAINQNSQRQLKKAIDCAPRGERAQWMLLVQVGTQNISPLMWAIASGAIESAKAMIQDLLTIRADRDKYYYHAEDLFVRHPDIILKLCTEAPGLLTPLFDGLIWRSRLAEDSMRRVNYYIKHLLVQQDGTPAKAIQWITESNNPKIVCHPVIVLLSDIVWNGVAYRLFLRGKAWFLFTALVFLTSQSLVDSWQGSVDMDTSNYIVLGCRCFIYGFNMVQLLFEHGKMWCQACRHKDFMRFHCIPLPKYLQDWQECCSLFLLFCLMVMLSMEPIIYCWDPDGTSDAAVLAGTNTTSSALRRLVSAKGGKFPHHCDEADEMMKIYSVISCIAVLLYSVLLIDLTVLSNRVSAFVLVCSQMFAEVWLFLVAVVLVLATFAAAISVLDHEVDDFDGVGKCAYQLAKVTLGMLPAETLRDLEREPVTFLAVFMFVIFTVVFLMNLLIAQLTCSYQSVYEDMVGFARLSRMSIISETMPAVSKARFDKFVASLQLDKKLEFNAGDVGVVGGVQVKEPANLNPQQQDTIKRFGGSTSSTMRWPEEPDDKAEDGDDKFKRLETTLSKAVKRNGKKELKAGSQSGSMRSSHNTSSSSASDGGD